MEEHPVLWHFTFSHFNEKARWALDYKGIRHVRHPLVPGFHASTVRKMTGQTAMPVLQMNGRTIHDSTRIIAALEETFPEPPLYPRAPAERARALELEEFFDEELGPHIRRVGFHLMLPDPGFVVAAFTSESGLAARIAMRVAFPMISVVMRKRMRIDEAGVEVSRKKTFAALDRLERELQPSGYLVGDRFSVADLSVDASMTSPAVFRPIEHGATMVMHSLTKFISGHGDVTGGLVAGRAEPMARVRESVAARPGFRWVLEMYRRHRGRSAAIAA